MTRIIALFFALSLVLIAQEGAPSVRLGIDSNHTQVREAAFSRDGRFVLVTESQNAYTNLATHVETPGDDQRSMLWDVATGRVVHRFEGRAIFDPDGEKILSWGKRGILWDVATGRELEHYEGEADVFAFADFSLIYAQKKDGPLRLYNVLGGNLLRRFDDLAGIFPDALSSNALSFRGKTSTYIYDPIRAAFSQTLPVAIEMATFSKDGKLLLTAGMDKTARLWNVATGVEIHKFDHPAGVVIAQFVPGHNQIVTVQVDKVAKLWDIDSGKLMHEFNFRKNFPVLTDAGTVQEDWSSPHLVLLPSGGFMATSGNSTAIWSLSSGAKLVTFDAGGPVAFSSNLSFFLLADSERVNVWEMPSLKSVQSLGRKDFFSQTAYSLSVSPNGNWLASLAGNGVKLWDLRSGAEARRFGGISLEGSAKDEPAGASVVFSPDNRYILTGPAAPQQSVETKSDRQEPAVEAKLWDLTGSRVVRRFELPIRDVGLAGGGKVGISANGAFAVAAHTNAVGVWNLTTGKLINRFAVPIKIGLSGSGAKQALDNLNAVAVSADGHWVFTGANDKMARLWDTSTGREARSFSGHTAKILAAAITADGQLGLTGSADQTARLWSLSDGRQVCNFDGHSGQVSTVAFSPDGRLALTGSSDTTIRLWDVSTCAPVRTLLGHSDTINDAVFSPDGRLIFSACEDSTVNVWQTSSGKLLVTLVSFPDGWAVIDPEGRYDASDPDSSGSLYWLIGHDVVELSQLKQRFYTPGLLAKILRGESLPPVEGLRNVKRVPEVAVAAPEEGSTIATIALTDRDGGIGRVIVKVNGREIPNATRGAKVEAVGEIKVDLAGAALSPTGKNVIEVFAENGDGVLRSRGVTVAWNRKPLKDDPPRFFAIVAGVSDYDNASLNLRYSAKDALDFGHALELAAKGLFGDRAQVAILASGTATEPTKENLRNAFDSIARQAHPGDLLVVYLAGHGVAARGSQDEYYFLTKEARSLDLERDPGLRQFSAISSAELKEWLGRPNMPLKQAVILDTCAAGAAFGEMVKLADRRELSADQIRAIELLKDATGSWILMGSAADAVSYEANRYAQGLLTYSLLQGMQGAALEGDQVEVGKLFGYAQRQVADLARGIGGLQRPIISAPRGQTFPIGLLSVADRQHIHLASAKPQLLRARVHDADDLDSLKLEPAVRAELRAASLPAVRGAESHDPAIAYLDSVVDEVPDALIPLLSYSLENQNVTVRLRLLRNGQPVFERKLEVPNAEPAQLAKAIAAQIVAASKM